MVQFELLEKKNEAHLGLWASYVDSSALFGQLSKPDQTSTQHPPPPNPSQSPPYPFLTPPKMALS